MPARHDKMHSELVKDRIRASMLINRLERFVLGEKDPANGKFESLSPAQVTAALGLLRKSVPDLAAIEHTGEVTQRHVVSSEPMTPDEWAATYGSESAARPN